MTSWIAFANDKLFGLANLGGMRLEGNRAQVMRGDALSAIIPSIFLPWFWNSVFMVTVYLESESVSTWCWTFLLFNHGRVCVACWWYEYFFHVWIYILTRRVAVWRVSWLSCLQSQYHLKQYTSAVVCWCSWTSILGFWPLMATHFNTAVSPPVTTCAVSGGTSGWWVSAVLLSCKSLCSIKFCLSFSEVDCFCALWNLEVPLTHLDWWRSPLKVSA